MMDHLKRIRRRAATADEMIARELTMRSAAVEATTGSEGSMPMTVDNDNDDDAGGGSSDHHADFAASSTTTTTSESIVAKNHPPERKRARKKRGGGGCDDAKRGATKTTTTTGNDDTIRPWSLDVLVGSVAAVDYAIHSDDVDRERSSSSFSSSLKSILTGYDARHGTCASARLVRKSLPGRPAETRDELDGWNESVWPTLFFEERTTRYREEMLALTSDEYKMMISGITEAVEDALEGQRQWWEWKKGCDRSSSAKGGEDYDYGEGSNS